MRYTEQLTVPVSVGEVWRFFDQPARVAACLPGCVGVEELEPDTRYRAKFADHIGPYQVSFDLDVVVEEREPERRVRLLATGKDAKLGLSQRVSLAVDLQPRDGATVLDVIADVEVLGKVAALGQFAIKRKARDVIKQLAENLAATLQPAGLTPKAADGPSDA